MSKTLARERDERSVRAIAKLSGCGEHMYSVQWQAFIGRCCSLLGTGGKFVLSSTCISKNYPEHMANDVFPMLQIIRSNGYSHIMPPIHAISTKHF